MGRHKYVYFQNQKEKVEELARAGVTDVEIAKITGMNCGYVQRTTTEYWKNKMEQKK